jgi:hypothetical protein
MGPFWTHYGPLDGPIRGLKWIHYGPLTGPIIGPYGPNVGLKWWAFKC